MATLGVLVTVYHRIEPDQLRACLASLRDQTRPADRTVIVADGPLTPQLEEVIAEHAAADAAHPAAPQPGGRARRRSRHGGH